MKLHAERSIFEQYPGAIIGAIHARGINNRGILISIQGSTRSEEKRIRETYSMASLRSHPRISAWRAAYTHFGAKPKEHRSSIENLYRTILEGNSLRHINNVVDIYNFVSIKHMLPAGGEDLAKIKGDITLCFAGKREEPVTLLGEKEARAPHAGEVIYKDEAGPICRRWNWREAERTKITQETTECILVIEALPPATKENVETALQELCELLIEHCGAKVTQKIIDAKHASAEF